MPWVTVALAPVLPSQRLMKNITHMRIVLFLLDFISALTLTAAMEKARPNRLTGTVKFFNKDKGFGFITPEEGGRDIFVHVSAVQRAGLPHLNEGMRLSFATEDDPRGRGAQAMALQLL